ncbi:hypothetical protein S83_047333, partial [Arachis hypogaea]
QRHQIYLYVHAILQWNKRMNLTAVKDADKVMKGNAEDSLAILPPLRDCYRTRYGGAPSHKKLSLVDVGTSAGLSGVILAITCPGEFFAAFFFLIMGSYTNGVHEQEMSILGACCWNYRFIKYPDSKRKNREMNGSLRAVMNGASIQQYISFGDAEDGELSFLKEFYDAPSIQLIEAEASLYWRIVCQHLESEARELKGIVLFSSYLIGVTQQSSGVMFYHTSAKGSDAVATIGTEAEVYAAEASDKNDLLEKILPATVNDYMELVRAHINA